MCKFYQGAEDKLLEKQLRKMFTTVHKDKPKSSRNVSLLLMDDLRPQLILTGI